VKSKGLKLLVFLLLGVSLAFGLLTSRLPQPSAPAVSADPNQPKIPVSALSPALRAKAQMLSGLQYQVQRYMSKHDDHQPGVPGSKRSLLYQLSPAGSIPPSGVPDPNQANGFFQAAAPSVPQRVILKLRQSPSSQKSSPSGALAPQAPTDPFQQIRLQFNLAEVQKVFPDKVFDTPARPEKTLSQQSVQLAQIPKDPGLDRLYSVRVQLPPDQTLVQFVDFCNQIPQVEYAEIDYPLVAHVLPNDPLFPLQWHLNNIGQDYPASGSYNPPPGLDDADIDAPEAWDVITDSSSVIIAVLDTGVDYEHPDLIENMWTNPAELNGAPDVDDDNNGYVDDIYGVNIIDGSGDPKDDNGHGTHCAGIIAAQGNNGVDISGVCWSAKIMALKFLDQDGSGSTLDAIEAVVYAVRNGAKILSNSYGGSGRSIAFQEAIDFAFQNGVVFVASAGNDGADIPAYPAAYDQALSVAAADSLDRRAGFSNFGDWVDLAAPGVDILSLRAQDTALGTVYSETTTIASGTSMACPVVAGACGLLLGLNPALPGPQVQPLLLKNLDPLGDAMGAPNGRLNACKAAAALYGQVWFGQSLYSCSSEVDVWVCDLDLAGQGSVPVVLQSDSADSENLSLTETMTMGGVFAGSIPAASGAALAADGVLQFSHGQAISVSYVDQSDIAGQPAVWTDTASADCFGPVLSNIEILAPGSVVTVSLTTDEPAAVTIKYGLSCQEPFPAEIRSHDFLTVHIIKIRNVAPQSSYYFVVESQDALGNVSVDDNNGQCFSFTTSSILGDLDVPADFPTIQSAVDRAWEGDTLWLADGVHTGPGNYEIRFDGKRLTVKSVKGPSQCIVDCDSLGRGFILNNEPNVLIEGITIKKGYSKTNVNHHIPEYFEGGSAIYAFQSNLVIKNCIFEDNYARGYGGAVYADSVNLQILDCIFTQNTALAGGACSVDGIFQKSDVQIENCLVKQNRTTLYGGGLDFWNASVTIANSQISDNRAQNDPFYTIGGGINVGYNSDLYLQDSSIENNVSVYGGGISILGAPSPKTQAQIVNCSIAYNQAHQGGGGFLYDCQADFVNCAIEQNSAQNGGGLLQSYQVSSTVQNCTIAGNSAVLTGGGIAAIYEPNSILVNSILWANTPQDEQVYIGKDFAPPYKMHISFSDVQGGPSGVHDPNSRVVWGQGNIDADPLFAFPADTHLLPGSPCIDQGTPDVNVLHLTDLDGMSRTIDGNSEGLAQIDMGAYEFDPSHPVIALSESFMEFQGSAGASPGPSASFALRNAGGGTLTWRIEPSENWIQVLPSNGIAASQIEQIQVQINTADLAGGDYLAELMAVASDAVNSPRKISIAMHLRGAIYVPAQYATIQAGLDAARDGDVVLVADGVYRGQGNRDIQFNGKAVHLRSENGPANCVIDAQGSEQDPHRAFSLYNTEETTDTIIEGFTLTGGYVTNDFFKLFPPWDGGAIWCGSTSPLIRNCIIRDNYAVNGGGAAHFIELSELPDFHAAIENCLVVNNYAQVGGGAFLIADFVDFSNSVISQNQCDGQGGAIYTIAMSDQKITNCTITGNNANTEGGGIYVWNAYQVPDLPLPQYLEISNSIVRQNTAPVGKQIKVEYTSPFDTFWGSPGLWLPPNIKVQYSCIPLQPNDIDLYPDSRILWKTGSIQADPLFADAQNGDYRLLPGSPAMDRGGNALILSSAPDLDGNPRILDADYDGLPQVDMGAYEFVPAPFAGPLIEISDWQFEFVAWQGEQNPPPQDFMLRNGGSGTFHWQIPVSCPWLSVTPQEGLSSAESIKITLQPDIAGLSRGLYVCQPAIDAPSAANHPRTFTVRLRVRLVEPGKIFVPSDFATIQEAIDAAAENDQIIVAPGLYEEDIDFLGKNITLTSQDPNDWEVVAGTVISGRGSNPAVAFSGTERSARLMGLTLTGGAADSGGGIQGRDTRASIEKCIISSNTASGSGGGIHAVMGRIADCIISGNTAERGGGIADCNDVVNCIITSNSAAEGGGLYQADGSIIHCTIADNAADKGAGASRCTGLIQNSIIWANTPDQLYRSSLPAYSCIQSDPRGEGNRDTDPEFIAPASGDYRLGPGSFCIDSANPNPAFPVKTDIVGFLRPFDGNNDGSSIPDRGAYEMPLWDQPVIGITQNQFAFTGTGPAVQTFKIWNASLPPVQYTVSDPNCSWLTVSPMAGTVFNAPQETALMVDPAQVPAGVYTCRFTISDPAAVNSPRTVDVRLTVFQDIIHLTPAGPTIQHALQYVTDGGTLLLADGVYSGPGNRDIDFRGRPATVKSAGGPQNCIIDLAADSNTPARGFLFGSGEGSDSILDGLTIINGYTPQSGGAVYCDGSSPAITDCVFRNNRSEEDGGAVYAQRGLPVMDRCVFEGNAADRGGAAGVYQGGLLLSGTAFLSNTAIQRGGAVFVSAGSITAAECRFTQNTAADGGAMFHENASGELTDGIFTENAATLQNWTHGGGAIFNNQSALTIRNCRFIENTGGWDGGAIENWRSSPHIVQCEFTGNVAAGNDGGALFNIFDSDPNILHCTFTGNRAKSWGGAMRNQQSSPTIENGLFVANDAVDNGGAVFNYLRSSPSIVNCTFAQNTAHGHEGGAMVSLTECSPHVVNSIFWANEAPQVFDDNAATSMEYSTIDWPGSGNIAQDPLFNDPNNGDFRLQRTSPCIDSAKDVPLAVDLAGDPRPWDCPWSANAGSGFDRGALEFTAVPSALRITPAAINLKSRGNAPAAEMGFPPQVRLQDLDPAQPLMLMTEKFTFTIENPHFSTKKGCLVLEIPIDLSSVAQRAKEDGPITISITALLTDGRTLAGTDTIRLLHAP
jgi:predicted outer membrane repeat protein